MGQWLVSFTEYLEAERNAAENAREAYRRDLEQWLAFLSAEQLSETEVTGDDIYAFSGRAQKPHRASRATHTGAQTVFY